MRCFVFLLAMVFWFPAWGASDDFSATSNPLSSPWASVSGCGDLQSMSGEARVVTDGVDSVMVYSTSTELSSQITWTNDNADGEGGGGGNFMGPALFNPSNGNGYFFQPFGTTLSMVEYTGCAYNNNSDATFTIVLGDDLRIYIDGNDVVAEVNGIERHRWTNTNHRTGLKPGIWMFPDKAGVDDWTDGAAGGGGSAVPVIMQQQATNDDEHERPLVASSR